MERSAALVREPKHNYRSKMGPGASGWRMPCIALVTTALLIGGSLAAARLIVGSSWEWVMTENRNTAPIARFKAFHAALPQISATPRSALILGVCFTEKGFIPEAFDQQLASQGVALKTFTIATASIDTVAIRRLAESVAESYRGTGTKPELVMVELTTSMLVPENQGLVGGAPKHFNRSLRALLIDQPGQLAEAFLESTAFGVEVVGDWLIGGPTKHYTGELLCALGVSAGCAYYTPSWWPWPSEAPGDLRAKEMHRYRNLAVPLLRANNGEDALSWSWARRGYTHRRPAELAAEYDAYLALEKNGREEEPSSFAPWPGAGAPTPSEYNFIMDYWRFDFEAINTATVDDPPFDDYLQALRTLKSTGARTIVYIIPKSHHLIGTKEHARKLAEFYDAAAKRIRALDIPVLEFNSTNYTFAEFQDPWALLTEHTGAPKFSRQFADVIAAITRGATIPSQIARQLPAGDGVVRWDSP